MKTDLQQILARLQFWRDMAITPLRRTQLQVACVAVELIISSLPEPNLNTKL